MPTFEKKVEYRIDFEKPILIKRKNKSMVSYSKKILKESILSFNGYVLTPYAISVVFLNFIIDDGDKKEFKDLTVSDVKNIIYNCVIEME